MKNLYIIVLSLLTAGAVVGQDCFTDFKYFMPVTLAASAEQSPIESSVVAVRINTMDLFDSGKLKADGSDLRVTDASCNPLPFFIQGIAARSSNVLYVKAPEITKAGVSIQVYYGSDDAQASQINGDAVFEFFDDFEDGVIDPDKWDVIGAHDLYQEADGELQFTGHFGDGGVFQYVAPVTGFTEPVTFDFAANANNSQVYGIADTADLERVGLRYNSGAQSFDTLDIVVLMFDTMNGGSNPGIEPYPLVQVPRNDLNMMRISAFIDGNNKLNYTNVTNHSTAHENVDTLTITQMDFDALRPFFSSFSSPIRIEFVGISPAASGVPSVTIGVEQMLISATYNIVQSDMKIFPNPVSHYLNLRSSEESPHTVSIHNIQGVRLFHGAYTERIHIAHLASGSYIVLMHYSVGVATRQIEIVRP